MTKAMAGGGPRVAGPPRSPNGASSFHLIWEMPQTREAALAIEVSVVLEILVPPRVDSLYFWALQVDFEEGGLRWGGGHTGLQWNNRFRGNRATNWGGYATHELGGAVLPGTSPVLPAFSGDPNTMGYEWLPGRPYRFRVYRSPERAGAWRAEIRDLEAGATVVLRDLMNPLRQRRPSGSEGAGPHSGHLRQPVVWSEVFADCDAPTVVVRWSDLQAITEEGAIIQPEAVRVNYQSAAAGGCANTTVRKDDVGLLQITASPREVEQGTRLELPRARRAD